MQKYIIIDTWMGLHLVWKNIKYSTIFVVAMVAIPFIFKDSKFFKTNAIIGYINEVLLVILKFFSLIIKVIHEALLPIYTQFLGENAMNDYSYLIFMPLVIILIIQNAIIYNKNKKYIIDLETGSITFPRSDIENSIFEIIFLIPYWNLYRSKTVNAEEVENIYIDTKRWQTKNRVHSGTTKNGKSRHKIEIKRHVIYTINIVGTFGSANLQFLDRQKRDEVRNAIEQCVKKIANKSIDRKVAEF